MLQIIIEGVPPYDGTYELDMSYFTNRELHLIKKASGVRAGELEEAFEVGDNDVFVALTAIAIWRKSGVEPNIDVLWDADAGKITVVTETDEDASGGLAVLPPPSGPVLSGSDSASGPHSGSASDSTTDSRANALSPTGTSG